jgi:hypothetical protein
MPRLIKQMFTVRIDPTIPQTPYRRQQAADKEISVQSAQCSPGRYHQLRQRTID